MPPPKPKGGRRPGAGRKPRNGTAANERIVVRVTAEEYDAVIVAAERRGCSCAALLRDGAERACRNVGVVWPGRSADLHTAPAEPRSCVGCKHYPDYDCPMSAIRWTAERGMDLDPLNWPPSAPACPGRETP